MKSIDEKGLTLVELLVAVMVLGLISVAVTAYLSSVLNAHASGNKRSALYREGLLAMERMTAGARRCTYLLIPNAHQPIISNFLFILLIPNELIIIKKGITGKWNLSEMAKELWASITK